MYERQGDYTVHHAVLSVQHVVLAALCDVMVASDSNGNSSPLDSDKNHFFKPTFIILLRRVERGLTHRGRVLTL